MSACAGTRSLFLLAFGVGFVLVQAEPLIAQASSAQIEISGTSTVRGWSCEGPAAIEVTPGNDAEPVHGFPGGIAAVVVTVPVTALRCGEGEEMEEHMQEALKADEHPEIVYTLEGYTLTGSGAATAGTLTVAGVTQPIDLALTLESAGEALRAVGDVRIDMTDFGVEPPTVFLGLLRVRDVATVRFDASIHPPGDF